MIIYDIPLKNKLIRTIFLHSSFKHRCEISMNGTCKPCCHIIFVILFFCVFKTTILMSMTLIIYNLTFFDLSMKIYPNQFHSEILMILTEMNIPICFNGYPNEQEVYTTCVTHDLHTNFSD